jgi:hypothetical protein
MATEHDFEELIITPKEWDEMLASARKSARSEGEAEDIAWCHGSAELSFRRLDLEEERFEREKALKEQGALEAAPSPDSIPRL